MTHLKKKNYVEYFWASVRTIKKKKVNVEGNKQKGRKHKHLRAPAPRSSTACTTGAAATTLPQPCSENPEPTEFLKVLCIYCTYLNIIIDTIYYFDSRLKTCGGFFLKAFMPFLCLNYLFCVAFLSKGKKKDTLCSVKQEVGKKKTEAGTCKNIQ